MTEFSMEKEVQKVIDEMNAAYVQPNIPPNPSPREKYDFEEFAEKMAAGMLEAANAQLEVAKSNLADTKARADEILAIARERAEKVADLKTRQADYSGTMLEAHQKFHNGS